MSSSLQDSGDFCGLGPMSAQKRETLTHIGLGILHGAFCGKHSAVICRLQISEERVVVVASCSGIEAACVGEMNMGQPFNVGGDFRQRIVFLVHMVDVG